MIPTRRVTLKTLKNLENLSKFSKIHLGSSIGDSQVWAGPFASCYGSSRATTVVNTIAMPTSSFKNYVRTLEDSSEISPKNSSSPYSELAIATDHSLHAPPRHLHLIIIAIEELIQVDQSDQLSAAAFTCLIGLININSYSDGSNGARAATHLLQY